MGVVVRTIQGWKRRQFTPPDFFYMKQEQNCTPNSTAYCRVSRLMVGALICNIFFACGYGLFSLHTVLRFSPVESLGTRLLQTVGMPPDSCQLPKGTALATPLLCILTAVHGYLEFLRVVRLPETAHSPYIYPTEAFRREGNKKCFQRLFRRWRTGRHSILSMAV